MRKRSPGHVVSSEPLDDYAVLVTVKTSKGEIVRYRVRKNPLNIPQPPRAEELAGLA